MDEQFKANFKKLMDNVDETKRLFRTMSENVTKIMEEIDDLNIDNETNKNYI